MDFTELFKDSICYSFSDFSKFIIIGAFLLIPTIIAIINQQLHSGILTFLIGIIFVSIGYVVEGYGINVMKDTIEGSNVLPKVNWKKNTSNGIKLLGMELVYCIGIAIIFIILLLISDNIELLSSLLKFNIGKTAVPISITELISVNDPIINTVFNVLSSASPSLFISLIFIMIISIIAMFFIIISTCRLAKTNSVIAALSWRGITADIKSIGIRKLIIWYILLFIIATLLALIGYGLLLLLNLIPIIGDIIVLITIDFVIIPFFILFTSRAMGLLYASA